MEEKVSLNDFLLKLFSLSFSQIDVKKSMEDAGYKSGQGDERECVERARAGDREAFEMLMNRYKKEIYALGFRMTGNHHDADDIAQETFAKAYFSLRKFRGSSSFKTWLYSIAINTSKTISAREGKARMMELPLMEGTVQTFRNAHVQGSETAARELLAESLRRLPERQKEVLFLKIFHGMKHREIAKTLGITSGAAKANLFHAMKFLKNKLGSR